MRYFTPILLLASALGLHLYNPSSSGNVLLFPFITVLFPSTEGDLVAQGEASERLLWGAGLLSLALAVWRSRREA